MLPFPWKPAVEQWVASFGPQAKAASVRLCIAAAQGDGSVRGRPADLRRAVANMLGNALKYSPEGDVVTITPFAHGHEVGVWIDDHGPGLAAEDLERVFEAGVQAPDARPGQGLGLHIARRICREHGGDVCARPRPQGARFEIRLPRVD